MSQHGSDRNLLFGILALQMDFITRDSLIAAMSAWAVAKNRPIGDILLERGDLDPKFRALLEPLVDAHVERHGDIEKSLAAVPAPSTLLSELRSIGDTQVDATISLVRPSEVRSDETGTFVTGLPSDSHRFRVLRPHAQGGLGAVFVALDGELNREVALKQILEHHADDPTSRLRFVLEAEITGGLEHPGIVPVYGLGTYVDGRPYYAMRFVRGESLKEAIASFHADETLKSDPGRRSLALRKLLRRFGDVCNAIDYAHTRGVIHRDIKPANVILGKHGETLVVDWGLAKALGRVEPGSSEERTLMPISASGSADTMPGRAMGTPAYMSPEQSLGDLEDLGPRSDVYSLGTTLYCMLIGKPPFEGSDIGAVLRAVQNGDFPPPRKLDPSIDKALEAVCLKAMALKLEDRYPTARALAEDVELWAADEPVSAWREPFARRARRWGRRNRTVVSAVAVAVVASFIGTAAVLAVQTEANGQLKFANASLALANEQVVRQFTLAMSAIELFHGEVSQDLLLKEDKFQGLRNKLLRGAAGFYGKLRTELEDRADPTSRAALADAIVELALLTEEIGDKTEALTLQRDALRERRALATLPGADPKASSDVAESLRGVGILLEATGKPAEALTRLEESRRILEGLPASELQQARLAKAFLNIDRYFANNARKPDSLKMSARARDILAELVASYPKNAEYRSLLASAHNDLASEQMATGHADDAEVSYRSALEIRRALAREMPDSIMSRDELAQSINNIAFIQSRTGRPAEALVGYSEAIATFEKLVAENPAVTRFRARLAHGHINIAILQTASRKPDEAIAAYRIAQTNLRRLVDENPTVSEFRYRLSITHNNIGRNLMQKHRPIEAIASYQKGLEIAEQLSSEHPSSNEYHDSIAIDHVNIAVALAELGRLDEAQAENRLALEIGRRLAEENPAVPDYRVRVGDAWHSIAWLSSRSGKIAESLAPYQEALAVFDKLAREQPTVDHYRRMRSTMQMNISVPLRLLHRLGEAREVCDRAVAYWEEQAGSNPRSAYLQMNLVEALLRSGQVSEASSDLRAAAESWRRAARIFETFPPQDGEAACLLAYCHASLSGLAGRTGSGVLTDEGKTQAEQAMEVLTRFAPQARDQYDWMKFETALDPIRARPDFQLLMMDLAFPEQPFQKD